MRRYAAVGSAAAGTNVTISEIVAVGATTRARIYDLWVSCSGAPASPGVTSTFNLIRLTASGTPTTTVTPRALDPGDPASLMSMEVGTFSAQTKTASSSMLDLAVNQHATVRWVAVPDGEMVIPATTDNCIGLESIASGGTLTIVSTFHWLE